MIKKDILVLPKKTLAMTSIFLGIVVYVFVATSMYAFIENSLIYTNWFNFFEAIGVIIWGHLSDRFCRRKANLVTQLLGLACVILLFFFKNNPLIIISVALLYSPLSLLKSALVDDFSKYSKVKLIAFAYGFQTLPWCFYTYFVEIKHTTLLYLSLAFLLFSYIFTHFSFYDTRDKLVRTHFYFSIHEFIHSNFRRRFWCTLLAFLPAQMVYFLGDNLLESYLFNPVFYSILSVTSIAGALLAIIYKKTPHTSVLTINYGISVLIALIPVICLALFRFEQISMPINLIIVSSLSSFGLPFVYDIMLNSVNAKYRGLTCGVLESLYSITSIINLALFNFVLINTILTLILIAALFLAATLIQRFAE